jgi:hypothetical protein
MYFLDFLSPIRDAFFLTASVGRWSLPAISAVGWLGNSLRSSLTSFFDHDPLTNFLLAISRLLSFICDYEQKSTPQNCSPWPDGNQVFFSV